MGFKQRSELRGVNYKASSYEPPVVSITEIDDKDKGTPDVWIPRHPELVRLTGRHPFNVEPPVYRLHEHGFITPSSLHYVRNHGAVPKLDWDSHKFRVTGAVDKPIEFTMDYLVNSGNFKEVTFPVTLVCAGNRRKEENMVKQGLGFSWGAGAVANGLWTGVYLKDILEHCGIKSWEDGAQHVCFLGADKLPNGHYGTSIRRDVAMDPLADVLVAYKMNGQLLEPDHGYPVRIIIPGYIGGRMVKWLTDITVTPQESDNHYHFFDNRVLPPQVDAERALAEGWWYKPEYLINELNINSSIVYPGHDEVVTLSNISNTYSLKGYAYAGGGLPVTRVEISLDQGNTWQLAELTRPEQPKPMGRYWCWVFWEYKADLLDLLRSTEVVCRAWQGQNTQPGNLTWNLLGMMNNCWFRCKVHVIRDSANQPAIKFEHPTQPGALPGGWMNTEESAPAVVVSKVPSKSGGKKYTLAEVAKHDTDDDCWIAVDGKVYDVTKFLKDHPGGSESITLTAGQDSTEEFSALHSEKARNMLQDYYIGEVGASATPSRHRAPSAGWEREVKQVALQPKQKVALKLIEREDLTHNVRRFRFALPTEDHVLGLPVGKHMFLSAKYKGEFVMRAYTPTTGDEVTGYVDFVIKVYNPCERFPAGGKMSQHLDSMALGDYIDVKGPLGEIQYMGRGAFNIKGSMRTVKRVAMMAGGTGITPMYQVAKAILSDADDMTECSLIFANLSEDDILLRAELDKLAELHPKRFRCWYTINQAQDPATWKYSTGFITEDMVREHLPPADPATVCFLCGPPPMLQYACIPSLRKLGYADDSFFAF